jgi:hypothetical protein
MKIERAWKCTGGLEAWQEITEERAGMDLANAHGDKAVEKLTTEKKLETRFAEYRIVE